MKKSSKTKHWTLTRKCVPMSLKIQILIASWIFLLQKNLWDESMRLESPLDYLHIPVKILQYPAPKYKSLIISRTSEILTLGEKSPASLGYLGSEAIFVKTVEKSKKYFRIRKKSKSRGHKTKWIKTNLSVKVIKSFWNFTAKFIY